MHRAFVLSGCCHVTRSTADTTKRLVPKDSLTQNNKNDKKVKSGRKSPREAGKIGVKQNTLFLLQAYNVAHYIDRKQSLIFLCKGAALEWRSREPR